MSPRKTSTTPPAAAPETAPTPAPVTDPDVPAFMAAVSTQPLPTVLGMIANRLASGTRRNGVVPPELEGIPKAALKKLADVLDLYADSIPPPPITDRGDPEATALAAGGGHVDVAEYLADDDPGAQYVPASQADPELEHSVADFGGHAPGSSLVGQPYPVDPWGPVLGDDEPAYFDVVGNPFSTGRAAPAPLASSLVPGPLTWPEHDSVSAIDTFAECGFRYLAEYGHGLKNAGAPAWWNVGGTAAHAVIEGWERVRAAEGGAPGPDDTAKVFLERLVQEIDAIAAESGVDPSLWRAANGQREGRSFWEDNGPNWVAGYVQAQEGRSWEPLQLEDGTLAIELESTVPVGPSGRPFKARIDMIMTHNATGEVRVRDYKYGRTQPPAGSLQLPAYRYVAAHTPALDMRPDPALPGSGWSGEYWLGRKSEATQALALPYELSMRRVVSSVTMLERARNAGVMMPSPSSFCAACPIKPICPAHTADGKSVIDNG